MSEAVTVAGGTPTLTLNDGGTATYTGGSGGTALTFSYTVAAGQNTSDLTVSAVNLNGATIKDGAGNSASLSGTLTPAGTLQIDTTAPTVTSAATSGTGIVNGNGDLKAGSVVTLTLTMSEAVTVAGGTPTLTLNDGGTATYTSGSGGTALTFSYTVAAGQNTSDLAVSAVNLNGATIKDGAGNSASLSGALSPAGTLQIDTTAPTVNAAAASGTGITNGNGDLKAGSVVTLTLTMSENVTVNTAGGTPTLTLNDGGTATYTSGSGGTALTFSYTVAAGQNTSDLAVTAFNANGATITDGAGNAATMTGAVTNPAGTLQIDTTAPTVASVAASGSRYQQRHRRPRCRQRGDVDAHHERDVTVNTSGGTPTLTLNDGATATYTGASGNALTFSYTVAAGQNTSDLAVSAVNLNGATIKDGAGNNASLSGTLSPAGTLQIDTTAPAAPVIVNDTINGNNSVTLSGTAEANSTVTVYDGQTTLGTTTANASGAWSYPTAPLTNGNHAFTATATDAAGNTSAVSNSVDPIITQAVAPTISSIAESPSSGDLDAGNVLTLTLTMSENVTVNTAGGTPTLTLNDGGTATYTGGSNGNTLTFSYTVAAGQNTTDLAATVVNLNSATITDGSGNAANLSLTGLTQTGPQIDTTAPAIISIAELPLSGDLNAGKVVTITLNMSEVVTVNTTGGSPTLTLNDGGTATYVGGSGTNGLVFSYTVLAGQNTSDLMETAVNLNGATITDGAGNAANLSLAGLPQGSPQIDTTAPTVMTVTAAPIERRCGERRQRHDHGHYERDSRCHGYPRAFAQRWRRRDLSQRLRHLDTGVQLHRGARGEYDRTPANRSVVGRINYRCGGQRCGDLSDEAPAANQRRSMDESGQCQLDDVGRLELARGSPGKF